MINELQGLLNTFVKNSTPGGVGLGLDDDDDDDDGDVTTMINLYSANSMWAQMFFRISMHEIEPKEFLLC